jgi:hypothetical protein
VYCEIGLFLTFGLMNRLHKCLPPWVDVVDKKVVIVILVAICFKLHQWTITQCNPCHKWLLLKNIDVIEIHLHQLVVAFNPFPPQLLSTKNRATNFGFLLAQQTNSMEMFSSSSILNSSSDES